MRTVLDNSMVAHVWAQQNQSYGRNGNGSFYFEGATIYSYGRHFPIAKFLDSKTVLLTTDTYSNTTQRHVSLVRGAMPESVDVFNVPQIDISLESRWAENNNVHHGENLSSYRERILAALGKADRARSYRYLHVSEAERLGAQAVAYAERFGLDWQPVGEGELAAHKANEVEHRKALTKAKKEREERERITLAEKVEKWRNGENVYIQAYPDTLLRVVGDEVQTSKGARFPVGDAVKAYRLVCAVRARGAEWRRNGQRMPVGAFELDLISAKGDVKAGCHFVRWAEIEKVGKELVK